MQEDILKNILVDGTQLVKRMIRHEISIEQFFEQYNNFYYYNALDGHEADDLKLLFFSKYSDVISLHKDIQTTVVDLVYLGDQTYLANYLKTGRISIEDAMQRLVRISTKYNIDSLLSKLKGNSAVGLD